MKKIDYLFSKIIAKVALFLGIRTVNAACYTFYHQPEMPEEMQQFKK